MTISEMHVWFRQYAQQMGMQNVRAILPEQIDLLINTSIQDTVNQIIKENIGVTNDRVITDNSKIGQINALRSLYTVKEVDCFSYAITKDKVTNPSIIEKYLPINILKSKYSSTASQGKTVVGSYYYFGDTEKLPYIYECTQEVDISNNGSSSLGALINADDSEYFDKAFKKVAIEGAFKFDSSEAKIGKISGTDIIDGYLFLVDFSLNYETADKGVTNISEPDYTGTYKSNYFPVRLIDDAYLADALNDFVLKNRLRSPILTIYNDVNKKLYFDLYIDEFIKDSDTTYYLQNKLLPYKFRISYIAKPAVVRYSEDLNGQNVDCNLPINLHIDILKHAVDLYRISITGALSGAQQQQQAQQQEVARNNYRNEGNPQQTQ